MTNENQYDFSSAETGWQDRRSREQQNRFSTRIHTEMNAERSLETSSAYDIVDQRNETPGERRKREDGTAPNKEREVSQAVKSASLGSRGGSSSGRKQAFAAISPPRNIERGDWDAYEGRGDSMSGLFDRATSFLGRSFSAEDVADAAERPLFRRPYDGTEPRAGSPAKLSVVTYDGKLVPLVKSPGGTTKYFSDFTLAGWQAAPTERHQITETFGVEFLKVFGRRPHFISLSGVLIDTPDFNWKAVFLQNWETTLRATRLVQLNARVVITVEDIVAEGYFLKLTVSKKASNNKIAAFQSAFYAKSIQITDSNIISTQVGTSLKALRAEAAEAAKDRRRRSGDKLEGFGETFRKTQEKLGEERDKLTRRDPKNTKPRRQAAAHDRYMYKKVTSETETFGQCDPGITCVPGGYGSERGLLSDPDAEFYNGPPAPVTEFSLADRKYLRGDDDEEDILDD